MFFAYIGFEAVSTAGQEAKNPRKDMPIGILGSLIICTMLYMATAAVLTGVVSFTKLNVAAPVATAVDTFGPQWGWLAKCIKIGAIAGLVVGGAGADVRPDARVLFDVARRTAAEDAREGASEVQDAVDQHADRRRAGVGSPPRSSTSTSSAT